MVDTWTGVLRETFRDLGAGVAGFAQDLIVAIIIVAIGLAIGALLGKVVAQIIKALKVDNVLRAGKVEDVLKRAGFKLDSGEFLGAIVKWFVVVVFLIAAFEVLGLNQVNIFLQDVLSYLPQVIVAVIILLAAALIADAMEKVVSGAAQAANVRSANLAGTVTRWAIWIFAILMALFQLGIAAPFIQTLFTGIIVALALGLGLSFGLGGQEAAARFIDKVRGEIKSHNG